MNNILNQAMAWVILLCVVGLVAATLWYIPPSWDSAVPWVAVTAVSIKLGGFALRELAK